MTGCWLQRRSLCWLMRDRMLAPEAESLLADAGRLSAEQAFLVLAWMLLPWLVLSVVTENDMSFVGVTCWNHRENRLLSLQLRDMRTLELSNNDLSGPILYELSNCAYLNTLVLSNNRLSGPIPFQLSGLGRLKIFSVANNHLVGFIPLAFEGHGKAHFAGNREVFVVVLLKTMEVRVGGI
ncbi:hypothetical protein F3Y22_tig00113726pilonHSYRG00116 [Hibiscus syriacus]|uniref:Uncharacterized protein n=1 Tax=Hibiscus syriacus TaxID=106335 RepID=A0A6A2WM98_HIBSY|nr:hypothetical protein F3Y22_tig00113726pilonHSYRG00116 [Hibiscus syriacus]